MSGGTSFHDSVWKAYPVRRRARSPQNPLHVFAFEDADGTALLSVKLWNSHRRAILTPEVHDRLVAAVGGRPQWLVDNSGKPHVVVRSRDGGEPTHVARFILETEKFARVHYADEDYLNLRAGNVRAGLSPTARGPKPVPAFKHNVVHHHRPGIEYVLKVRLEDTKKRAAIDKADYDRFVSECGVTPWRIEGKGRDRRVVFQTACPGIVQAVSEYLAGGPLDAAIFHKDGDFLNLRASNLTVMAGG